MKLPNPARKLRLSIKQHLSRSREREGPAAKRWEGEGELDKVILDRAKAMRREMTPAEYRLWSHLRDRRLDGLKFRRQVPLGPYIVEFLCKEEKLVVEVDGGQHSESAYDARRDAWLKAEGYCVLRLWNDHVLESTDDAIERIRLVIAGGEPPPV